ncbi:hypothetical protein EOW66_19750 [Sinirhodobacter huangdaonensis]|uniref:Uncharacterized protein n=1 Tax=Paenirhodobacter huangdaonensis TaxID=2501515 RepID=A0A443LDE2_9RHOB|nr:hypothetical protein [Sinirhodobacter huangdaonensis]RWR47184.1 hypothetical protein EOW66_19750 [Sinirhodobacter huangdaonensis]
MLVGDTARLEAGRNAKRGPYDQKQFLGFRWRSLTADERRDSPAFQLGPIKIGRGAEPAKNDRERQRLRERLKRGEKLSASEMIAAGH